VETFEGLASARAHVRDLCKPHVLTVMAFRDGWSFKKCYTDRSERRKELHSVTTTATCIESLLSCPRSLRADTGLPPEELLEQFCRLAVARAQDDWQSEQTARIYARCRGLPLLVANAPHRPPGLTDALARHLRALFAQLIKDPTRIAIGEADTKKRRVDEWYPPSAFYTYWTLSLLQNAERSGLKSGPVERVWRKLDLDVKRVHLLHWQRQQLGTQMALHASHSPELDTDELCWSLIAVARFGEELDCRVAEQDILRRGLSRLFERQHESGIWPRGKPLFHYEYSGEAYCYGYETLAELLRVALLHPSAFLREALRPYAKNLVQLADYAAKTGQQLPQHPGTRAWTSGHAPTRSAAEGWATASVYAYLQRLRQLLGVWTRQLALRELNWTGVAPPDMPASEKLIAERGDTWCRPDDSTVGHQLMTLIINPIRRGAAPEDADPDSFAMRDGQARSAVLFGPPGTGKTTLAKAVAGAVGWDYLEILPSDFLVAGEGNIHKRADAIFARLVELDRCVVLFDEIDGLVRSRSDGVVAWERMLTTSMLPRLARLWNHKRVVYFAATNHLEDFDDAVTRAQRFDALLFVPPLSLERKKTQLCRLMGGTGGRLAALEAGVTVEWVEKALATIRNRPARADETDATKAGTAEAAQPLAAGEGPARLLLLRWDQLRGLARRLGEKQRTGAPRVISCDVLRDALKELEDGVLDDPRAYLRFLMARDRARLDTDVWRTWQVEIRRGSRRAEVRKKLIAGGAVQCGERLYLEARDDAPSSIPGLSLSVVAGQPGVLAAAL
jgi:hypothetical protein